MGDRVAHVFNNFCGKCLNCRLGHANFCLQMRGTGGGGFAEQATLYAGAFGRGVFKVPDAISTPEAALCEPLTCAIGAVLKCVPQPGERIVVIGLGGLGQLIAQILASAGVAVIGIDQQPDKLRNAAKFCHAVIDAVSQDVIAEVLQFTGNVGADAVIVTGEATGRETSTADLSSARGATKLPVVVGSGVTAENAAAMLQDADAVIVGSALKKDGHWTSPVELDRVKAVAAAVQAAR